MNCFQRKYFLEIANKILTASEPKKHYDQSNIPESLREVDFYLIGKKPEKRYRCEVKLMGKGNPEGADVIHARDLVKLFYEFIKNPMPGEVYNVGGSRRNSISLLESIDLIEDITGRRIDYKLGSEREADHKWWITNINKARADFPKWDIRITLKEIFKEIYDSLMSND